MNDLTKSGSFMPVDPAAFAAAEAAKARIQTAYQMAMMRPRNEDSARARILKECRRPSFAREVEFSKPVGGKKIRGLSIRFAEMALREWRNILSETTTIYEDDGIRRIRVSVLDLETNTQFSKEIQIRKTVERKSSHGREIVSERLNSKEETVFVVIATDDELSNKENAIISKTIRNEGLRMLPSDLKEEARIVASETIKTRSEDPEQEKKDAINAFAAIGVMPEDIERLLGHSVNRISPKEHGELRRIIRAISDGEATWESFLDIEPENVMTPNESRAEKNLPPINEPSRNIAELKKDPKQPKPKNKKFVPPRICANTACSELDKDGMYLSGCASPNPETKDPNGSFVGCNLFVQGHPNAIASGLSREKIEEAKKEFGIGKTAETDEEKWAIIVRVKEMEGAK